eukprot:3502157-Pyramimonas_sp.AAC.1
MSTAFVLSEFSHRASSGRCRSTYPIYPFRVVPDFPDPDAAQPSSPALVLKFKPEKLSHSVPPIST